LKEIKEAVLLLEIFLMKNDLKAEGIDTIRPLTGLRKTQIK